MGCACVKSKKEGKTKIRNIGGEGKDVDRAVDNDEKRKNMLEAAEAREKKQKMHGMSEKGYQEYEEKVKKQKIISKNDNYEPLNWNS